MATVRVIVDVEIADREVDGGELSERGERDAIAKFVAAANSGAAPQMHVLCGEPFYGMGYSTECTKAYAHEGDHSTMTS